LLLQFTATGIARETLPLPVRCPTLEPRDQASALVQLHRRALS
jgi:hypothetical protein